MSNAANNAKPENNDTTKAHAHSFASRWRGSGKLEGKVALITGGDSGIGRATAISFAKEGADVVIVYHQAHDDAKATAQAVQAQGRRCLTLAGDIGRAEFVADVVGRMRETFGRIDVLVNNAAEQHPKDRLEDVSAEQVERTFRTNVFAIFELTAKALPLMGHGGCIVNTTSVTAYRGSEHLVDYAATKGAIVAFTRSLAKQLAPRGIRVNAVAPGPIWTPLVCETFPAEHLAEFGKDTLLGRAGEADEVAPSFVFLASSDASYMTGQVLHPNGGEIVNT